MRTLASIDEAKAQKAAGKLVAAERNTQKCDFADFGNSPFDFTADKVVGREICFTTTNGTRAVDVAKDADEMIIAAFSNIDAVVQFCESTDKNIIILCSGWNDRFSTEDTLFAGALTERLIESKSYDISCDATRTALELWQNSKNKLHDYMAQSEHYARLKRNGLEDSVPYCLTENITHVLPRYQKEKGLFTLSNH